MPARLSAPPSPPASSEERLVAELIALMEKGGSPWRRPWREEEGGHVNLFSGRPYRGANPVLLSMGMQLRGSTLPFWCGWGEARRLGVAPRRGSRGVLILRPVGLPASDRQPRAQSSGSGEAITAALQGEGEGEGELPPSAASARAVRPAGVRCRPVVVFNAADLVGDGDGCRALAERIGRCLAAARAAAPPPEERLRRAEATLRAWPVPLLEGGGRACYLPESDRIHLPAAASFSSAAARLATWGHEAIHSTGHPGRLGRDLSGPFGSAAYAREELLAELGAVLLGERLAIGSDTSNHAAYLEHWCALLRETPQLLLRLLGEARRAADLIAPEATPASDEEGDTRR